MRRSLSGVAAHAPRRAVLRREGAQPGRRRQRRRGRGRGRRRGRRRRARAVAVLLPHHGTIGQQADAQEEHAQVERLEQKAEDGERSHRAGSRPLRVCAAASRRAWATRPPRRAGRGRRRGRAAARAAAWGQGARAAQRGSEGLGGRARVAAAKKRAALRSPARQPHACGHERAGRAAAAEGGAHGVAAARGARLRHFVVCAPLECALTLPRLCAPARRSARGWRTRCATWTAPTRSCARRWSETGQTRRALAGGALPSRWRLTLPAATHAPCAARAQDYEDALRENVDVMSTYLAKARRGAMRRARRVVRSVARSCAAVC
jgi:hypothetical protein